MGKGLPGVCKKKAIRSEEEARRLGHSIFRRVLLPSVGRALRAREIAERIPGLLDMFVDGDEEPEPSGGGAGGGAGAGAGGASLDPFRDYERINEAGLRKFLKKCKAGAPSPCEC